LSQASTRDAALEKMSRFKIKIGYPDVWVDYSSFAPLATDSFVEMGMKSFAFEVRRENAEMNAPTDRTKWFMTPQTINAYYHPSLNEIVFPAAILRECALSVHNSVVTQSQLTRNSVATQFESSCLCACAMSLTLACCGLLACWLAGSGSGMCTEPPFFNPDADDAVNYGAMGAIVGHEMTHGFDDQGRKYNSEGNMVDWWTEEDGAEYERRVEVMVKQASEFEVHGTPLQGKLTCGAGTFCALCQNQRCAKTGSGQTQTRKS
jgi:predicted metalloendopeptidase